MQVGDQNGFTPSKEECQSQQLGAGPGKGKAEGVQGLSFSAAGKY